MTLGADAASRPNPWYIAVPMSRASAQKNAAALATAILCAGVGALLLLASRPGDPLAALGHPGWSSPLLVLVALVPAMLWLELAPQRVHAGVGALGALVLGFGTSALAAYGAAASILPAIIAQGYPEPDAWASAQMAAALQASTASVATLLAWYAVRRGRRATGFFAFAWVAAEGLAPLGAERLSVALFEHPSYIALASIGGPSLVSLVCALVNGALAECLLLAVPPRRRPYLVLAAIAGVGGSLAIHQVRVEALSAVRASAPDVRLLVVQPAPTEAPTLVEQTRAALDDVVGDPITAVVWPAVTYDEPIAWAELDLAPRLPAGVDEPFLVGTRMARDAPPEGPLAHALVLTDEARQRSAVYQTTVLAPFLDFAPLEEVLPDGARARIHDAGRRPGQRGAMFEIGRVPFGVMVGWDDFSGPDLRRQLSDQDPEWLLSVVDDRAFADTPLPTYHEACAVFRAVEQGRYVLRAAAHGGSTLIDPVGARSGTMPLGEGGAEVFDVPRLHAATGYQVVGNFATLLCLLFAVSLVLLRPPRATGEAGDDAAAEG